MISDTLENGSNRLDHEQMAEFADYGLDLLDRLAAQLRHTDTMDQKENMSRVYASLGYNKPLRAIDAATGKTLTTYEGTDGTLEVVLSDGVLYIVLERLHGKTLAEAMFEHRLPPDVVQEVVCQMLRAL